MQLCYHLERLHPLIYPLTNVGTAGYLGTSTSQPDLFILGDEKVIHPLTRVPCTLSTYSERVNSTLFKRESFQIGRFIEGKDHPLDVLTSNDEKFNKLIRGASRSLGLTFESGALFSSMSKLEGNPQALYSSGYGVWTVEEGKTRESAGC